MSTTRLFGRSTEAVRCRVRSPAPGLDIERRAGFVLYHLCGAAAKTRCGNATSAHILTRSWPRAASSLTVYPEQTGPMGDLEPWHVNHPTPRICRVEPGASVSYWTACLEIRRCPWHRLPATRRTVVCRRISSTFGVLPESPSALLGALWHELARLARRGRWLALADQSRQISKHFDVSPRKLILRHGIWPLAPKAVRSSWRALKMRARQREPWASIVSLNLPARWPQGTLRSSRASD